MARTASVRNDTVYTDSARFDKAERRLSEKELMTLAPLIFAVEAHASRSERFAPIPTIEVLRRIAKEGFVPVGVKQSTSRDPGRAPFTKHLIRLRRIDGKERKVGDTVFEMLLKNANDGTAAYHLFAGLWRIRCMNSLVAKTKTLGELSIRHTGDAPMEVLEGSFKVLEQADKTLAYAEAWGKLELKELERAAFARKAHKLPLGGQDFRRRQRGQPDQAARSPARQRQGNRSVERIQRCSGEHPQGRRRRGRPRQRGAQMPLHVAAGERHRR